MEIGNFLINEPVPELKNPHVIASLRPWLDAGGAGTLTLSRLERHLGAKDLGTLVSPGKFFDFTRYRPIMHSVDGRRTMNIPNVELRYAYGPKGTDFIFLHMLEPHVAAEEYIDSIVQLLTKLNVSRYCRVGGMYDAVPHTRQLPVMGMLNGEPLTDIDSVTGNRRSNYQGPTSIMNLIGEKISGLGIENMTLMVRLPGYLQLEEDYSGAARLRGVLCTLYDLPAELGTSARGVQQYKRVSSTIEGNPEVKALVQRLEAEHDARQTSSSGEAQTGPDQTFSPLSPSVEQFLRELGNDGEEESQ
jgi:hypothetical protein